MARPGPELIGRLFDENAEALTLYARQWCRTAEDVVQEAFIALAKERVCPESVVGWLYRVVRNGAISSARGERRRQARETKVAASESVQWFSQADERLDGHQASALLAELEPDVREVVIARVWGGLTFDVIARLQSCSLTTAHRRFQAGLAQLHERLETHATVQP